jgi:hypothetical protein
MVPPHWLRSTPTQTSHPLRPPRLNRAAHGPGHSIVQLCLDKTRLQASYALSHEAMVHIDDPPLTKPQEIHNPAETGAH